jgi:hypothetical protein
MKVKPNFFEIHKNESYKVALIDSLTGGITDQWMDYFEMTMNYVICEKHSLFRVDEFSGTLYEDEDEILDLILPAVRRVFGKVFVTPPKIFVTDETIIAQVKNWKSDGRLELFRLHYDIDEFIDYLVDIFPKTKRCLSDFENIDRSSTILEIIVDNYIGKLVKLVTESEDIAQDTRDMKLKRMVTQ